MIRQIIHDLIEANPIIPAVKDDAGLERCCALKDCQLVFTLYGNVCTIPSIVKQLKDSGKRVIVDIDLINGLGAKPIAADFLRNMTEADGILSTKPQIISRASELGFWTALRIFLLDSMAYENIQKQVSLAHPDVVEIMPGTMPKIIGSLAPEIRLPILASGLIRDKEDVLLALQAGAFGISTTNVNVWEL